jgi:predicted nucleic acid-binding protein
MITAIDTNILLDILVPNQEFYDASEHCLEESNNVGSLVVCDLVYAELCVHFPNRRECDEFLDGTGIRVESIHPEALFLASRVWRTYRKQGGQRDRILPDFLIAAHAQIQASRLLSRDCGFYGKMFPSLMLMDLSASR